jgi:hypothetical protein
MIGSRIGNYELVREIPGGGMGRVFEAIQLTLSRTVAIKVLRQELAESDDQAARFRREADTLARLDHENIVRVYDVVEHEGAHYIVMEYVGGPPLGELLGRSGRFPPAFARDIAADIAGALSAAHGRGIIHRDIKPGNILFTTAGRPKLADFGIARIVGTATSAQSQLVGTPYYMSPEQVRGEGLSPASDVYSLGIVLYEMLSGRLPFDADTPIGVALKHVQEAPPAISTVEPDLPADLCRLIDRALEKDTARRYATAEAFQDALQRLDLGPPPGRALRSLFPRLLAGAGAPICRGCTAELRSGFLTCPHCGRPVRGDRRPVAAVAAAAVPAPADGAVGPAVGGAGAGAAHRAPGADLWARIHESWARIVESWARGPGLGAWIPGQRKQLRALRPWPAIAGVIAVAALGAALVLLPGSSRAGEASPTGETQEQATPTTPTTPSGPSIPESSSGGPPAVPTGGLGGTVLAPRLGGGLTTPPLSGTPTPPRSEPPAPVDPPATAPERPARRSTPATPDPVETARDTEPRGEPATPGDATAPELDEAAALREIDGILDRQRRATQSGDIDLLLLDVDSRLHRDIRRAFTGMHRDASDVTSEITNRTVRFISPDTARVSFHAVITGTRRNDRRRITITDRIVVWQLSRSSGRWLIVSST